MKTPCRLNINAFDLYYPPPKAAEDHRTPKREAVSNLSELSIPFPQAAQLTNVRQLLDCASPLALSRENPVQVEY